MTTQSKLWRSLLFVPAHVEKFVARAHERGADACILDLEDSVPLAQKEQARAQVAGAIEQIVGRGLDVLVRINSPAGGAEDDLAACVRAGLSALVLPKIACAEDVRVIDVQLATLEQARGLVPGSIGLLAQIEDVAALPRLDEIARSSARLWGMSLGPEDFCVSAYMQASIDTLFWPTQQVAFACRRAGIQPYGFPASIAEFSDLELLHRAVDLARQLGMVGAFCIHPAQVAVLNQHFSPSAQEVEDALALLAERDKAEAEGRGAFAFKGRMVDPPVVVRALETLNRHQRLQAPRA